MHVLLLHDVSHGSSISEIFVVEEIHDRIANCKYNPTIFYFLLSLAVIVSNINANYKYCQAKYR